MVWLSVSLLALGIALDLCSLVAGVHNARIGRNTSIFPLFWLFYVASLATSPYSWALRGLLLVLLTGFHLFCQCVGASLYKIFLNGRTPMHRAVVLNRVRRLELLLTSRADPNAADNVDWTPLHVAAGVGRKAAIELLLRHGADLNAMNSDGRTPLHVAADVGNMAAIELLLQHEANPNAGDNIGWTPLHEAVRARCTTAVELLLRHGADVNAVNNDGRTPLHVAASVGRKAAIELLLRHGANPALADKCGRTARALVEGSSPDIEALL